MSTASSCTTASFDTSPTAERDLLALCAAPRWAREVAAGRPYGTLDALLDAADRALTDADLDAAMAGHPRIGDRTAGGRSRREQGAVTAAGTDVLDALAAGNRAYEERFGHVYLVCATGRSAEDLLATLHARLRHDPATERAVALAELAAINRIRLRQLLSEEAA
ncbi:2-oxo-4-hydroxy-4-carboxy-5-ureidoimidazoline decarboxylase [Pseudonocardia broussonetiae]|uniref:2-oxo-4-hydroxy-4-carboxy-5-ureidoimidazoline decarboxylase n=1 Tax=Pseudonocardia broussonetiae TaxID=2736640 RepID=A0A6M6JLI1_9PSEU|nr:2-oxo-4-hydroxy-4-carboxy-5-ureidoimidazoline decarboxylase [Pseudonocardia broussonetiae]QJY48165.1 2-oxo-4-hydroxy-4-carboxy-5-ureidoimidazoline decarboxylase [Pseudonocardia broussonetiae]